MRPFRHWFSRTSKEATIVIGHSRVRLAAIDSAMFMTRSDDPTIEAILYLHSPHADVGRIRVRYRGSEAETLRTLLRRDTRY
jgi:hypothetical protein